jgi:hypothetical protein
MKLDPIKFNPNEEDYITELKWFDPEKIKPGKEQQAVFTLTDSGLAQIGYFIHDDKNPYFLSNINGQLQRNNKVKFWMPIPFQPERLNPETPKGDAIV